MPEKGIIPGPYRDILTYDEITAIITQSIGLGMKKVRLSGGEPLVRRDLVYLVEKVSRIPGLADFSLTTNASLLEQHAASLRKAGLGRVNISLDTLNRSRFRSITIKGELNRVMAGIEMACNVGFAPVKINTVMIKGFNNDELVDLLKWSNRRGCIHRFIELMPMGNMPFWGRDKIFTEQEARAILERHGELVPLKSEKYSGPARYYHWEYTGQTIGFISPLTHHFCRDCNRLRMTADGKIHICLFTENGYNIRDILRTAGPSEVKSVLSSILEKKISRIHTSGVRIFSGCPSMSKVGG
jgi:cyclic pyranopterin phosphate synthase